MFPVLAGLGVSSQQMASGTDNTNVNMSNIKCQISIVVVMVQALCFILTTGFMYAK